MITVGSGKTATVINIRGNNYRLVVAIHYDKQRMFILRFMPHDEYSANLWKDSL